jgi:hypothetical protein
MCRRQETGEVMRSGSKGCNGARQRRRDVLAQHSGIVSLPSVRVSSFAIETVLLCTVSMSSAANFLDILRPLGSS